MNRALGWIATLSIDAPLVSLAWMACFATAWGAVWSAPVAAIVGLSVWLGYAADRWIDAQTNPELTTSRHAFHREHRWTILAFWVAALASAIYLAARNLDHQAMRHGLILAASSIAYTAITRHNALPIDRSIYKAFSIAALVAASSFVFVYPYNLPFEIYRALIVAGLVCLFALNCLFIYQWEGTLKPCPALTFLTSLGATSFAMAGWLLGGDTTATISIMLSLFLLQGLHLYSGKLPLLTRRALADLALLTPWLILPFR